VQDRSFLIEVGAIKALRPSKGQEPAGAKFSHRDLSRRTGYPTSHSSLTKEPVMGIIAWIVLGLGAGLLANMLIPGRRSEGLILTCLIGVAGALLGGWLATKLFHIHTLHGFFNLSTWLTAIAGAALLLLIFHLVTSRRSTSSGRRTSRRRSWAHR
jgi:uncharacterized membrane protein YeaQ/YmgE (transglycosylase-associated protein family)